MISERFKIKPEKYKQLPSNPFTITNYVCVGGTMHNMIPYNRLICYPYNLLYIQNVVAKSREDSGFLMDKMRDGNGRLV